MLEDYSSTIIYELGKCDPANNRFTDAIKAYADINEINENGVTPLITAVYHDHADIVDYLMQHQPKL